MLKSDSQTDYGLVKIHRNVIASIAVLAACETEGIKCISGNLRSTLLRVLGKKDSCAIRVEFDRNGEARLEVPVVVKYNYNIPQVASRTQENIRNSLEKMTNLNIREINISVQAIERS